MVNRKSNSPWGSSYKEGLPSTAVNDNVDIDQNVKATITTGSIDVATGQWKGVTLTDEFFVIDPVHEAVANGASALSPQKANHEYIDMTGYNDLFIAIKPSSGGNYGIKAVMGPSTYMFSNLTPVVAAATLKYSQNFTGSSSAFTVCLDDSTEALTADAWNILKIEGRLNSWKLLQFSIENNTGAPSNIQFASLRVV